MNAPTTSENSVELKFLTIDETAEILRVKRRSVYLAVTGRLRGTPQLPALRFGKRILIKREKLDQWVEQNYGGLANGAVRAQAQDPARKRN